MTAKRFQVAVSLLLFVGCSLPGRKPKAKSKVAVKSPKPEVVLATTATPPRWFTELPAHLRPEQSVLLGFQFGDRPGEYLHLKTGLTMVWIPPGEFVMGGPGKYDGWPTHQVRLAQGFLMSKYEVTWKQYHRFCKATGRRQTVKIIRARWRTGINTDHTPGLDEPARRNWDAAVAYCDWAGLRLPSEAEWEYACRAGTDTDFFFGNNPADLGEYAWFNATSEFKTHPIGRKRPNAWGLYDILGNAWEHVQDTADPPAVVRAKQCQESYVGAPQDGSAWEVSENATYRIHRGGGWLYPDWTCRSGGSRETSHRSTAGANIGFRPVIGHRRRDVGGEDAAYQAYLSGDYLGAFAIWKDQADWGNAAAMSNLGILFQNGQGVKQDYAEAARWLRKAADADNAGAMCNLGQLHFDGLGVPRDLKLAMSLFQKAPGTYPAMYAFLCALELGARDDAQAGIRLYVKEHTPKGWEATLTAFCLGELSEAAFLAEASNAQDEVTRDQRRCEAAFYSGAVKLAEGTEAGGKALLRECLETKSTTFREFRSAKAMLERLGK